MQIGAVLNQRADQFSIAMLCGNPEGASWALYVHELRRALENLNGVFCPTSPNSSNKRIHRCFSIHDVLVAHLSQLVI